jgi:hypothetical protein
MTPRAPKVVKGALVRGVKHSDAVLTTRFPQKTHGTPVCALFIRPDILPTDRVEGFHGRHPQGEITENVNVQHGTAIGKTHRWGESAPQSAFVMSQLARMRVLSAAAQR